MKIMFPYQNNYTGYPQPSFTPNYTSQSIAQAMQQIPYVNGIQSAQAYSLAPNSQIALFDQNSDMFYFVKSDASGFKSVVPYDFTLHKENVSACQANYVTLEEFNELKSKL